MDYCCKELEELIIEDNYEVSIGSYRAHDYDAWFKFCPFCGKKR